MEWPTLGKRAIAKPTEQPTKKARRRELRNRNIKLHLVFEAGNIPEALEEKIEAYFIPKWLAVFREKFGDLHCIPNGPVTGQHRRHIWEETVRLSKKFLYWSRRGSINPPITRSLMQPLLGKEILLNYTNRGGHSTEMYPKVVNAVFANSAQLADPDDGEKAFTISLLGVNAIRLEANWIAPNPDYREDHLLRCYVCGNFTPAHGFCTCRD